MGTIRTTDNTKGKKQKPPLPKYYFIIYAVLLGVFAFSAYQLIDYFYGNYKAEKMVDSLSDEKDDAEKITNDMLMPHGPTIENISGLTPGSATDGNILSSYQALHKKNPDMAGWITIPNTKIDYPVLYRKDDNSTYLHTDFNGNGGSKPGSIFLDGRSHFLEEDPSMNLILYGHNMHVGTMFHDVLNYKEESYYKSHPIIQFDTLYMTGTYDIIAVFPYDDAHSDSADFVYYHYNHITSEDEFTKYLDGIKKAAIYDTGITATWGDELITLSTCADYDLDTTKRFVVVARKR